MKMVWKWHETQTLFSPIVIVYVCGIMILMMNQIRSKVLLLHKYANKCMFTANLYFNTPVEKLILVLKFLLCPCSNTDVYSLSLTHTHTHTHAFCILERVSCNRKQQKSHMVFFPVGQKHNFLSKRPGQLKENVHLCVQAKAREKERDNEVWMAPLGLLRLSPYCFSYSKKLTLVSIIK